MVDTYRKGVYRMTAWGTILLNAINGFGNDSETGLVRLFRVEYSKEYQQLKKSGCEINDRFVKEYLNLRT
jgi:hypothetical protein